MTSLERAPLVRLRAELAAEIETIQKLLAQIAERRTGREADADPVWLAYLAISVHQYYTALEGIFERICRVFEGSLPTGADTHQALLRDMALELPGVRAAVLKGETVVALRPLLKFRHFVRHAYAVVWDANRIADVEAQTRSTWSLVERDLGYFLGFLDQLTQS